MRIAITDSGVGGLSVCAALESALARHDLGGGLEVAYLNAALEDDYAYNSMATRREQRLTFDRFLDGVTDAYTPDLLFIACNTLSVMFADPFFSRHDRFPIIGIVDSGVAELRSALARDPDAGVIIFATPITIGGNTYRDRLLDAGVAPGRIVQQACPGLPDAISNDVSGDSAARLLDRFVPEALDGFPARPDRVLAFLGCTHFGYQAARFRAALTSHGVEAGVIDPNMAAAGTLLDPIVAGGVGPGTAAFEVVSRYRIPDRPRVSLSGYLGDRAPATLAALLDHTLRPDLFHRLTEEELNA